MFRPMRMLAVISALCLTLSLTVRASDIPKKDVIVALGASTGTWSFKLTANAPGGAIPSLTIVQGTRNVVTGLVDSDLSFQRDTATGRLVGHVSKDAALNTGQVVRVDADVQEVYAVGQSPGEPKNTAQLGNFRWQVVDKKTGAVYLDSRRIAGNVDGYTPILTKVIAVSSTPIPVAEPINK